MSMSLTDKQTIADCKAYDIYDMPLRQFGSNHVRFGHLQALMDENRPRNCIGCGSNLRTASTALSTAAPTRAYPTRPLWGHWVYIQTGCGSIHKRGSGATIAKLDNRSFQKRREEFRNLSRAWESSRCCVLSQTNTYARRVYHWNWYKYEHESCSMLQQFVFISSSLSTIHIPLSEMANVFLYEPFYDFDRIIQEAFGSHYTEKSSPRRSDAVVRSIKPR